VQSKLNSWKNRKSISGTASNFSVLRLPFNLDLSLHLVQLYDV
jgi:hypothetical protein